MNVPANPLADFSLTVTITAKNLATEITNFNMVKEDMQGEEPITTGDVQNNQDVRDLLIRRGIVPKNISLAEDMNNRREADTLEDRFVKDIRVTIRGRRAMEVKPGISRRKQG